MDFFPHVRSFFGLTKLFLVSEIGIFWESELGFDEGFENKFFWGFE
jgi:hypothetical protein